MKIVARWGAPLLLALLAACASTGAAPVPVRGETEDVLRLDGEWAGEYGSAATGRSGSIVFRLAAGADTARGDVVMIPRGAGSPLLRAPAEGSEAAGRPAATPQTLTIRLVRVEGTRVDGVLDPYLDPECSCPVYTRFEGEVRGDRISGTFASRGAGPSPVTGTWSVRRR